MPVKQMPSRFSRRWWRLWRSGAIAQVPAYLRYLADELQRYWDEDPDGYRLRFNIDPEDVRRGRRLAEAPRVLLDLGARCRQDMQLSHEACDEAFHLLIGQTAREADKKWTHQ